MPSRSRQGYYVEGEFVPAGSAADAQFRALRKGTEAPSRTERKHASEELQALGEELVALHAERFAALPMPEKLREAIVEARRLTHFGALRRQRQYIGKLMRGLDAAELAAVTAAIAAQHQASAAEAGRLHRAERWRDELIAGDDRLGEWLSRYPGTDAQQLRALLRQARKDAQSQPPGAAQRQGRAKRQVFALVRAALDAAGD